LPELWLSLFHGFPECLVVCRALDGAFYLIGSAADVSENAAENAACRTESASCHPRDGSLELTHISVTAAIAEKLELVPFVGGVIGVVSRELNQCHIVHPL
jgi:hypothetical protein